MASLIDGPWTWRNFAGRWLLVREQPAVMILGAEENLHGARLVTHAPGGERVPITPDHPVARRLAAAGGPGPVQLTELQNLAAVALAQRMEDVAALHRLNTEQLRTVLRVMLDRLEK